MGQQRAKKKWRIQVPKALREPWLWLGVALIAGWYIWKGCPIFYATGIACPGCGITRAGLAILRLDTELALHFHPGVLLLPIVAAVILPPSPLLGQRGQTIVLGIAGTLFGALYIYRMFWGDGSVVFVGTPQLLRDVLTLERVLGMA